MRAALAIVWLAAACDGAAPADAGLDAGSDAGSDAGAVDAFVPTDAGPPPLEWTRCTLENGEVGECATLDVPLRWSEPEGRRISISLRRLPAVGERVGSLWVFEGGPGGSVRGLETFVASAFAGNAAGYDVVFFEQRGIGESTRVGCPVEEGTESPEGYWLTPEEIAPCLAAARAEWGEDLDGFSTTEAVRDLHYAIERTREPDERVVLWGVSYGTFFVRRYLSLFPDEPTAVVLESIVGEGSAMSNARWIVNHDAVGRDVLSRCTDDTRCAAALGADPVALWASTLARLEAGHCPEVAAAGLDAPTLRLLMGALVQRMELRRLVPAIVHRLDRCDPADVTAMLALEDATAMQPMPSRFDLAFSFVVHQLITQSESLLGAAQDPDAFEALHDAALFTAVPREIVRARGEMQQYPVDAALVPPPVTSVPILGINADLDPQTPLASATPWTSRFVAPDQRLVIIERGVHAPTFTGTYPDMPGESCGIALLEAFIADPSATLDTVCGAALPALSFADDAVLARTFFATDSLYENVMAVTAGEIRPDESLRVELARSLRRWGH